MSLEMTGCTLLARMNGGHESGEHTGGALVLARLGSWRGGGRKGTVK